MDDQSFPMRRHPVHGVMEVLGCTTVVFVTICTLGREPWLADEHVHSTIRDVWMDAQRWLVGPHLLMPDHMHSLACPGDTNHSLERWHEYWKHLFSSRIGNTSMRFQYGHWDIRIRSSTDLDDKWSYVQSNPVRKGLVARPDDWPFRGIVHDWSFVGPYR